MASKVFRAGLGVEMVGVSEKKEIKALITSLFSYHYFMQRVLLKKHWKIIPIPAHTFDNMGACSELIFVTSLHKMISAIDDWTRSAIDILHFEIISFTDH